MSREWNGGGGGVGVGGEDASHVSSIHLPTAATLSWTTQILQINIRWDPGRKVDDSYGNCYSKDEITLFMKRTVVWDFRIWLRCPWESVEFLFYFIHFPAFETQKVDTFRRLKQRKWTLSLFQNTESDHFHRFKLWKVKICNFLDVHFPGLKHRKSFWLQKNIIFINAKKLVTFE